MSEQIELDEEIQQDNESNHDINENTHQQLLSSDSGKDQDGQGDECVEEMKDNKNKNDFIS